MAEERIAELAQKYGICDVDDFSEEYEKYGILRQSDGTDVCGKYLLYVGDGCAVRSGEKKSIIVPEYVKRIANHAFEGVRDVSGIVLPSGLEVENYEHTFLPAGLDWVVVPKLPEAKLINRLFRGINSPIGESTPVTEYKTPVIYYMGNRDEIIELKKHFGIKELKTTGKAARVSYYCGNIADNADCHTRMEIIRNDIFGWHFNDSGIPTERQIYESINSVIFDVSKIQIDDDIPKIVRSFDPYCCAYSNVSLYREGANAKLCENGIQIFSFDDTDEFFRKMTAFARFFGLSAYFQVRNEKNAGDADNSESFSVYETDTESGENKFIGKSEIKTDNDASAAKGDRVMIDLSEKKKVGYCMFMALGMVRLKYPELDEISGGKFGFHIE